MERDSLQSFEQLVQRRDQLQGRLGRKQHLVSEEIPRRFKEVDPDDFKTSIRLGQENARLDKDIHEVQNSIANKENEITAWAETHGQELIKRAQIYTRDVAEKRGQLEKMEELAASNYVPKDVFEQHKGRLRVLAAMPGQDPALKLGIELLQRQKEQEKQAAEAEPKPAPEEPKPSEQVLAYTITFADGKSVQTNDGQIKKILEALNQNPLTNEGQQDAVFGPNAKVTRNATTTVRIKANKLIADVGKEIGIPNPPTPKEKRAGVNALYEIIDKTVHLKPAPAEPDERKSELEQAEEFLVQFREGHRRGLYTDAELQQAEEDIKKLRSQVVKETPPVEPPKPEEPEKEQLPPNIIFDKNAKTLTVNGKGPFKLSTSDTVFLGYLYDRPNEQVPSRDLKDAFSKAGLKSGVGVVASDIERKIGEKIFKRIGHTTSAKWSLPRKVEIKEIVEKEEPAFPEKRPEQIIQIIFNPDNNMITKNGEQISIGEFLGAVIKYLYENQGQDVDSSAIFQVLKDAGSKLNDKNNVTPYINSQIRRKLGNIGDLIQITNKDRINHYALSPDFSVTMEKPIQLQDELDNLSTQFARGLITEEEYDSSIHEISEEYPELKGDLENKRDDLATNIEQLQTRISSIEAQIISGDLSEKSNPMLDALRKALDEKKAELAEKEKLLESLPASSSNGIIEIPYQRPPETIRTTDETNLLTFVAEELSKFERLWFDRIQSGLNAYQNPYRNKPVRGTNLKRFKPFESNELKPLFESAYKKMQGDSQVPLRRKEWGENEELVWTKLQDLIQRIGEGDERKFFQRVNGLIDRAANEYYALHQDIKPGEGWII